MVSTYITAKLENLQPCHSHRIIFIHLPLKNNQHAAIFSVYAPCVKAEPADRYKFYSDLSKAPLQTKM